MTHNKTLMAAGVITLTVGAGMAAVIVETSKPPECVKRVEDGPPEGCLRLDKKTGKFTWESPNVVFPAAESSGGRCIPVDCLKKMP